MCGIVGYIGYRDASSVLIKGLKRLEYRGYDSAGIALLDTKLEIYKTKGKVARLAEIIPSGLTHKVGMGHTRWATHGEPTDINAHPHLSPSGNLAVIHNGIIENYGSLKEALIRQGHTFHSDTDTEVLIHLVEEIKVNERTTLEEAVRLALNQVIGAYALVILSRDEPSKLIAARKGSPLVVGYGEPGEFFLASDATPIIEYTRKVTYLNDGEMVFIKDGTLTIKTIENVEKSPYMQELEINLDAIEKGGYEHFMLKEIYEQPKSVLDSFRGRVFVDQGVFRMRSLQEYEEKLRTVNRVVMLGCGTSWHAALVGEYLFEELARIHTEVEYASEFRYRNPVINKNDLYIAISQSGETADTLAAVMLAKKHDATVFGICNVVGSSIPRLSDAGAYTHAGPEIGVASTKAFTSQITVLTLLALALADLRGAISKEQLIVYLKELERIPDKVEQTLKLNDEIVEIAKKFKDARNFLYLGRGVNFPVALEGALKLKEISYIHAEGYPAAEVKHGPIALIDEVMPVVFIAPKSGHYGKIISNIQEVKARRGIVIAIVSNGDEQIREMADHLIEIPDTEEIFSPLLTTIPLQLLSYHIAVMRGCNVDQPRNLAKSVTVE
ncbi:MAG: glutamine--fructose-6-phosphate transaminase (isomerizing) [Bacteroidales bacterium]|nr:glutamine--fructose-6-phosphate transaminase (isomerizing) [Bacteroidales bacterium]